VFDGETRRREFLFNVNCRGSEADERTMILFMDMFVTSHFAVYKYSYLSLR